MFFRNFLICLPKSFFFHCKLSTGEEKQNINCPFHAFPQLELLFLLLLAEIFNFITQSIIFSAIYHLLLSLFLYSKTFQYELWKWRHNLHHNLRSTQFHLDARGAAPKSPKRSILQNMRLVWLSSSNLPALDLLTACIGPPGIKKLN